jgi:Tol biopolymer transport system component
MTQDRWQQIWSLYQLAGSFAPSEWSRLIESQTDDPELRARVFAMLRDPQSSFHSTFAGPAAFGPKLAPGRRIGRYRVVDTLASGGMGEVYAAVDDELRRPVALKIVASSRLPNQSSGEAVMHEAKAASALNHPHIVTVYEVIPSEVGLVIVMEQIDGLPLRASCGKRMPFRQVAHYGEQIARALVAAHRADIVHGDVKPENIMVRTDGYVKLLDFGLAREISEAVDAEAPFGTWRYMSPEQISGQTVSPASDVFSLGIVLYELAEGRHPFEAPHLVGTLQAIASANPVWQGQNEFTVVLQEMLAKRPDERPSAAEAANRLSEIASGSASPSFLSRRGLLISAAAVLAPAAWYLSERRRQAAPWLDTPMAGLPGEESAPQFSPNGNQVAFVFRGDAEWNAHVYLKAIGGAVLRLTNDPRDESCPCWSPDGGEIAFLRQESGGTWTILTKQLPAGEERRLGQIVDRGNDFRLMTWLPDGSGVLVSEAVAPGDADLPLIAVMRDGHRRPMTAPPVGSTDAMPQFSPDGRNLAFVRMGENGTGDLHLMPFPSGQERSISPQKESILDFDWTPDGLSLILVLTRESKSRLYRQSVSGGLPLPVPQATQQAFSVSAARKGSRLAYQQTRLADANIWEYPLTAGDAPRQLIASNKFEADARYSPDGSQIAFSSTRMDRAEIWICASDGSSPRPLTSFGPDQLVTGSPCWSPDGKRIVFDTRPANGKSSLYWVDARGGQPHRLTHDDSTNIVPQWSYDGARIYFSSDRSGRFELWSIASEGGPATQFSTGGGFEASPSSDGEFIFFTRAWEVPGIWRQPVSGGNAVPVRPLDPVVRHRYWQGAHEGIWFVDTSNSPTIKFYSFATGQVRPVAPAPRPIISRYRGLAIAPDGGHFLYLQYDVRRSEIRVVQAARFD